jgi:steroid delta-isomerase-like uncharacterized protein
MSTDESKDIVRRLYTEVLERGDLDAADDFVAVDYVEHGPLPGQGKGIQGLKQRATMLRTALAPRFSLEDVIAEGDRVVVRWRNEGTHVGDFAGIPATGRSYAIDGIDVYRVHDGMLIEHWDVVDQLTMLQQLGVIPVPQEA